jgi:hypothetical protein
MSQVEVQKQGLTAGHILVRLQQRVSQNNARLLLNTAKTQTGIKIDDQTVLEAEQAKALCLRLINQGGPAFQVGQAIYKEYSM